MTDPPVIMVSIRNPMVNSILSNPETIISVVNPMAIENSEIFISTKKIIWYLLHFINLVSLGVSIYAYFNSNIFLLLTILSGIVSVIASILLISNINKMFVLYIVSKIK